MALLFQIVLIRVFGVFYVMSNETLKCQIVEEIALFEKGELSCVALINSITNTCAAIEAIPYEMVAELRGIISRLTIEYRYEEEGCISNPMPIVLHLKEWLSRVPE